MSAGLVARNLGNVVYVACIVVQFVYVVQHVRAVRIAMTTLRNPNPRLGRRKGNPRRDAVLETAKNAGLLAGANGRIAARIRRHLVNAAKARSGIKSDTELLEYALARVALEDDFGQKLIARQGRVPRDVDLEF